ncbi:MAG: hypothetical protein LBM75_10290 [Myxococcales bacterium]|nr:hypothetical protein [Myxococcales bacterium]
MNAMLYFLKMAANKESSLRNSKKWNTIYSRTGRFIKKEILSKAIERLKKYKVIDLDQHVLAIDSTSIEVHPDASGAQKNDPKTIG